MSPNRRRDVTASELMAQLAQDPTYVAEQARQNERRQRYLAELRQAEEPLINELRSVGCLVESAWDLVNTEEPYPEALPVLVRHLQLHYPDRVKEGIARALAVPPARFAWTTLLAEYRKSDPDSDFRAGLAAVLAAVVAADVVEDLVAEILDPRNGESRVLLVQGLAGLKNDRARAVLADLRSDPVLGQSVRMLRSFG